jgi:di/tripeptidase
VAVLAVEPGSQKGLSQQLKRSFEAIKFEYRVTEPEMKVEIKKCQETGYPLTSESHSKLINLILSLPHGVVAMHPEISGLVETSSNLAIVETQEKKVGIICNSRSSVGSAWRQSDWLSKPLPAWLEPEFFWLTATRPGHLT